MATASTGTFRAVVLPFCLMAMVLVVIALSGNADESANDNDFILVEVNFINIIQ